LHHKHVPEIQQHAGLKQAPVFVPAYGNYRQGIVVTIALHLRLLSADAMVERLHPALQAQYAGQPIEVQPLVEEADAQRLILAPSTELTNYGSPCSDNRRRVTCC